MIKSIIFTLLATLFFTNLKGQQNEAIYIFGHSLIDHRPPLIPTPQDETTVPFWLASFTSLTEDQFSIAGQYGFLGQYPLPPISQWGYETVESAWNDEKETFGDADFSSVMITAPNFIQWQSPTEAWNNSDNITTVNATFEIMDWCASQQPNLKFYLYENWPEMAFNATDFPPSAGQFAAYQENTLGEFHDWWIEYQDVMLSKYPDFKVKMIPVGPIIAKIQSEILNNEFDIPDFYEDSDPHGRASTYFLAALISYSAIYQKQLPEEYVIPEIILSSIRENQFAIEQLIWNELMVFNNDKGESRVFFELSSQDKYPHNLTDLNIAPNPTSGTFNISGSVSNYFFEIIDVKGKVYQKINSEGDFLEIDLSHLVSGTYLLSMRNKSDSSLRFEKIIKY